MIFNYSILRGYTALRGTMVIHLPYLISMLIYVKVPSTECIGEIEGETQPCFDRGLYWYYLAVGLHALLTVLHLLLIIENEFTILPQSSAVYVESAKIFAIPLQVLNFIFQCTMYLTNPGLNKQN